MYMKYVHRMSCYLGINKRFLIIQAKNIINIIINILLILIYYIININIDKCALLKRNIYYLLLFKIELLCLNLRLITTACRLYRV